MNRRLNPKQLKFVEQYLTSGNATQSYVAAGYRSRGHAAEVGAQQLLRNTEVRAALDAAASAAADRAEITATWVLERLKIEALREGDGSSHAARVKAIELLGKTLKLFVDKQELSGPDGVPLEHGHRITLTAEDLDAADRLAPLASGGIPPHGGPQPVHPDHTAPAAAAVPLAG
jgi:phage terminase small subunit